MASNNEAFNQSIEKLNQALGESIAKVTQQMIETTGQAASEHLKGIHQQSTKESQENSNLMYNKDPNVYKKYEARANSGDLEAQMMLASYYATDSSAQGLKQARKWAQKAAMQGNLEAQLILAQLYTYGIQGEESNFQKAIYWAELAAKKDFVEAQEFLGVPSEH